MARRDESILNVLVECPWWARVLILEAWQPSGAAPFVALVLLLPAPVAALNSWIKRKHRTRK
jgi:hypothetical protein